MGGSGPRPRTGPSIGGARQAAMAVRAQGRGAGGGEGVEDDGWQTVAKK